MKIKTPPIHWNEEFDLIWQILDFSIDHDATIRLAANPFPYTFNEAVDCFQVYRLSNNLPMFPQRILKLLLRNKIRTVKETK